MDGVNGGLEDDVNVRLVRVDDVEVHVDEVLREMIRPGFMSLVWDSNEAVHKRGRDGRRWRSRG